MGCRHLQSLITEFPEINAYVIEPNLENFQKNCEKIGYDSGKIKLISLKAAKTTKFDLVIIATLASKRIDILKEILSLSWKKLLIEKVVFNRLNDFTEYRKLFQNLNKHTYINFVNRYFPSNISIKEKYSKSTKLTLSVFGGDVNYGSNAIHYIDLFEYITNSKAVYESGRITETSTQNKRGNMFSNYHGECIFKNNNDDYLHFNLNESLGKNNAHMMFNLHDCSITVNEKEKLVFETSQIKNSNNLSQYKVLPTSELTAIIYKDIIADNCLLPHIYSSKNAHQELFKSIQNSKKLNPNKSFLIT